MLLARNDTTILCPTSSSPTHAKTLNLQGKSSRRWLATGSWDASARLWDMQNPSADPIDLRGHVSIITALAFSPDGRWLATTGILGDPACLWNMQNPSADPIVLRGYESDITALAFSPDGRWLATGSGDAAARLWDMQNPSADPIVLRGHGDGITDLAFSPDGRWLATGSGEATARLWKLDIGELITTACRVVGRNLTRVELAQYFPDEDYRKTCDQWELEPEPTQ